MRTSLEIRTSHTWDCGSVRCEVRILMSYVASNVLFLKFVMADINSSMLSVYTSSLVYFALCTNLLK